MSNRMADHEFNLLFELLQFYCIFSVLNLFCQSSIELEWTAKTLSFERSLELLKSHESHFQHIATRRIACEGLQNSCMTRVILSE